MDSFFRIKIWVILGNMYTIFATSTFAKKKEMRS